MTHARPGSSVPGQPAHSRRPPPDPQQRPRPAYVRRGIPRWLGHLPYVVVLCGVATGLAVVAIGHFKKGSLLLGTAVLCGALVRLVLPESQVGLLAIRRRAIDVLILVGFAVAIAAVAYVVQGD